MGKDLYFDIVGNHSSGSLGPTDNTSIFQMYTLMTPMSYMHQQYTEYMKKKANEKGIVPTAHYGEFLIHSFYHKKEISNKVAWYNEILNVWASKT